METNPRFNWEDTLGELETLYFDLYRVDPARAIHLQNGLRDLKHKLFWTRKSAEDFEKAMAEQQALVQMLEAKHGQEKELLQKELKSALEQAARAMEELNRERRNILELQGNLQKLKLEADGLRAKQTEIKAQADQVQKKETRLLHMDSILAEREKTMQVRLANMETELNREYKKKMDELQRRTSDRERKWEESKKQMEQAFSRRAAPAPEWKSSGPDLSVWERWVSGLRGKIQPTADSANLIREIQELKDRIRPLASEPAAPRFDWKESSIRRWAKPAFIAASAVLAAAVLLSPTGRRKTAGLFSAIPLFSSKPHLVAGIPSAHNAGLVLIPESQTLLTADWMSQKLFPISLKDGKTGESSSFPNPFLTGLTAGGGYLWSSDSLEKKIYQHNRGNYGVVRSFDSPGPNPSAIHWKEGELWIADRDLKAVFRCRTDKRLEVLGRYALEDSVPAGIASVGSEIWVLDSSARQISRYQNRDEWKRSGSISLSLPEGSKPSGLAVSSDYIFVGAEKPSAVYRLPNRYGH